MFFKVVKTLSNGWGDLKTVLFHYIKITNMQFWIKNSESAEEKLYECIPLTS